MWRSDTIIAAERSSSRKRDDWTVLHVVGPYGVRQLAGLEDDGNRCARAGPPGARRARPVESDHTGLGVPRRSPLLGVHLGPGQSVIFHPRLGTRANLLLLLESHKTLVDLRLRCRSPDRYHQRPLATHRQNLIDRAMGNTDTPVDMHS